MRSWLICGVALLVVSGALRAAVPSLSPGGAALSVPTQVEQDARVARARMVQIWEALNLYMNEHNERLPARLSALYPTYISDPLVFHHPGDPDPPPTTIDNDIPNATNSARISFKSPLPLGGWGWQSVCQPSVIDNGSENNAGLFVNQLQPDGWVTDPPNAISDEVARVIRARSNLRTLGLACHAYVNDNREWFPNEVLNILSTGPLACPGYFWNPGDDESRPEQIDNDLPNVPNSARVSFEYVAPRTIGFCEPPAIEYLFRDNSPANNGGFGRLAVTCWDFQVLWFPECAGDTNLDRAVDLADLEVVAQFLAPGKIVEIWEGDLNADGVTDLADAAMLQRAFGSNCGMRLGREWSHAK
ncbi:MAG: dockerin type I repeat-containing protein [Phycisphaerae bacterium]|nr:dockerin type I repeat-containing protein [Phycisphaerae bacterium]